MPSRRPVSAPRSPAIRNSYSTLETGANRAATHGPVSRRPCYDFVAAKAGDVAPFRVGVAGLGTVGAALVRMLLNDQATVLRRGGRPVVATHVAARNRNKDRGIDLSGATWMDDAVALARDAEIDLFVELIGGEDGPAYAAIRAALERGVPVVTANKALLAKHGIELARIAESSGSTIGFEAAVAGGIPGDQDVARRPWQCRHNAASTAS